MKIIGPAAPLSQPHRWTAAAAVPPATKPTAPRLTRCPSCDTIGRLASDFKPGDSVTCSECDAQFTPDLSPTKDGRPKPGVLVPDSGPSLAARTRPARMAPRSTLTLAERVRASRRPAPASLSFATRIRLDRLAQARRTS